MRVDALLTEGINREIRKKIIDSRKVLRLTQGKVAMKAQLMGLDLTEDQMSKIETGVRRVTPSELFFIAKILNIDLDSLAMRAVLGGEAARSV